LEAWTCLKRQSTQENTFVAVVRRVEVSRELARATVGSVGDGGLYSAVRYTECTRPSSRALAVEVAEHVHSTADVAVVSAYTASDRHAPVHRLGHDDYLAVGTHRLERLGVADLTRVYNTTHHPEHYIRPTVCPEINKPYNAQKSRNAPTCRVLPPGELNHMILQLPPRDVHGDSITRAVNKFLLA